MNELSPAEQALRDAAREYHRTPTRGKISVTPTKPLSNQRDLSLAYSPGVAYPCLDIQADPSPVWPGACVFPAFSFLGAQSCPGGGGCLESGDANVGEPVLQDIGVVAGFSPGLSLGRGHAHHVDGTA